MACELVLENVTEKFYLPMNNLRKPLSILMKVKQILFGYILMFFIIGCGSVQRNETLIAKGDYDKAIELAVKKLQKNKNSNKNEEHVVLLEDAFKKAVEKDSKQIKFLKKAKDVFNTKEIFYLYRQLSERQGLIQPLLPLYSKLNKKEASFKIKNYQEDLIEAKNNFIAHLYDEGSRFMNYKTILDYRTAYEKYCEITDLQSNYKNTNQLLEESHYLGTDFVFIKLINYSGKIIPYQLERDLLNFNTYDLDTFWTEYHNERQGNIDYSFEILLNFTHITISAERISERIFNREKEIKYGWKYKKDRNGNNILDQNGNPIKIDLFKTVRATVYQTQQTKSTFVKGNVVYKNAITGKDIEFYPLATEFIFENFYAHFSGDKRALTSDDLLDIDNRFVHFPNNEKMVFDAGEDIKLQLKEILKDNSLR